MITRVFNLRSTYLYKYNLHLLFSSYNTSLSLPSIFTFHIPLPSHRSLLQLLLPHRHRRRPPHYHHRLHIAPSGRNPNRHNSQLTRKEELTKTRSSPTAPWKSRILQTEDLNAQTYRKFPPESISAIAKALPTLRSFLSNTHSPFLPYRDDIIPYAPDFISPQIKSVYRSVIVIAVFVLAQI